MANVVDPQGNEIVRVENVIFRGKELGCSWQESAIPR